MKQKIACSYAGGIINLGNYGSQVTVPKACTCPKEGDRGEYGKWDGGAAVGGLGQEMGRSRDGLRPEDCDHEQVRKESIHLIR